MPKVGLRSTLDELVEEGPSTNTLCLFMALLKYRLWGTTREIYATALGRFRSALRRGRRRLFAATNLVGDDAGAGTVATMISRGSSLSAF
jgi:hypothetical protein